MSALPQRQNYQSLREHVGTFLSSYLNTCGTSNPAGLYQIILSAIEPEIIEIVLNHVAGNQSEAAHILGISRTTLRNKIKKYRLTS